MFWRWLRGSGDIAGKDGASFILFYSTGAVFLHTRTHTVLCPTTECNSVRQLAFTLWRTLPPKMDAEGPFYTHMCTRAHTHKLTAQMGFLSRWKTKTWRTQSCDYMVGEVGWMDDPFGRCTIKPTDCLKSGKRDILKHQENWCFTQIHSSIRLIRNDIFGPEVAAWLIQINRWQQFFFFY